MTCYDIKKGELFVWVSPAHGPGLYRLLSHGEHGTGEAELLAEKYPENGDDIERRGVWEELKTPQNCNFNMYADVYKAKIEHIFNVTY